MNKCKKTLEMSEENKKNYEEIGKDISDFFNMMNQYDVPDQKDEKLKEIESFIGQFICDLDHICDEIISEETFTNAVLNLGRSVQKLIHFQQETFPLEENFDE